MLLGPYKNLTVWKESIKFTKEIYKVTCTFPDSEQFGITNQMRRAAVSIASNIAEGYGRQSNTDLIRFLHMSLGSINEIDTQIIIASEIGYLTEEQTAYLSNKIYELSKMMNALINTRKSLVI